MSGTRESRAERGGVERRAVLGAALGGLAAVGCTAPRGRAQERGDAGPRAVTGRPTLVGSANALAGMQAHWAMLEAGADPLDVAIEVVKVVEADPEDSSVGLGGLPNEDGVVQLDAAVMHGPTHNSGAVACIENILHPSEVARLVMERTDHCLIVGAGAYRFARAHGHPHTELLTDAARRTWLRWRESMSEHDDRLPPRPRLREGAGEEQGALEREPAQVAAREWRARVTGTVHCSALAVDGAVGCTTTTSGLAWKIPGRVGDSPIVGAGLYCDQEAGSAGGTGRGEAAILANASFAIVDLLRMGRAPKDAGMEVLRRIARQVERQARWQPALRHEDGGPAFGLKLYVLGLDGTFAGVSLRGAGSYAVADAAGGPRHEELEALY